MAITSTEDTEVISLVIVLEIWRVYDNIKRHLILRLHTVVGWRGDEHLLGQV